MGPSSVADPPQCKTPGREKIVLRLWKTKTQFPTETSSRRRAPALRPAASNFEKVNHDQTYHEPDQIHN